MPVLVLAASLVAALWIARQKPAAEQGAPTRGAVMTVAARTLARQQFRIELPSQGVVRPRTESKLVAQVSGAVVEVSERLREGAFFERGDLLLAIDDRDYRAEVEIAAAGVTEAELKLADETARGAQAARDWQRFGDSGPAPDLVARKPQRAAAEAALQSAKARLAAAQLKVERCRVRAPFAGRVQKQLVDFGQVVGVGGVLAEIYATDVLEVRLPLDSRALAGVDLPEVRRDGRPRGALPAATILARRGDAVDAWPAQVVRVDGAIDSATRQLSVVARIDDPYGARNADRAPLKIGQFVEARVAGRVLRDVFVLPATAVRQDDSVLLVDGDRLRARALKPVWRSADAVVVAEGLSDGEVLSLTPLGAGADGARVKAIVDGRRAPTAPDEAAATR